MPYQDSDRVTQILITHQPTLRTYYTSLFNIILFSVTHKMQGSEQHSTDCLESLSKIWLKTYHLQGLGHIAWLEFLQGIKNEWSIYGASKWGVVKFIKFIKTYKNSNSQTEQREVPGSLGNYCSMSSSLRGPVNPSPSKAENIFQLEYSLQDMCLKSIMVLEGIYTKRTKAWRKFSRTWARFRTWSPMAWGLGFWTCWSTN